MKIAPRKTTIYLVHDFMSPAKNKNKKVDVESTNIQQTPLILEQRNAYQTPQKNIHNSYHNIGKDIVTHMNKYHVIKFKENDMHYKKVNLGSYDFDHHIKIPEMSPTPNPK